MPKRRSFLAFLLTASLGLAAILSSSPATYYPHAIGDFGGTSDYLTRGAGLTGAADGKLGLFSHWFRVDGGSATRYFFINNTLRFYYYLTGAGRFTIRGKNSSNNIILNHVTTTTYMPGASWYHLLASFDLGNSKSYIYVDDVSRGDTPITLTDDSVDYTSTDWGVAASTGGSSPFNGALSEVYFTNEYLDISVTANRRLFIDAAGDPVPLGADGSLPTGTAPIVYMRERVSNAGINSGTGGDFTINGAPLFTEGPVPFFPLTTLLPDRGRGRSRGIRIH